MRHGLFALCLASCSPSPITSRETVSACTLGRTADYLGRFKVLGATNERAQLELLEPLVAKAPNDQRVPSEALRLLREAGPGYGVLVERALSADVMPRGDVIAFVVWNDGVFADPYGQGLFVRRQDGLFTNAVKYEPDGISEAQLLSEARRGSALVRQGPTGDCDR
ncbi:MAG: hypothetical protein JNJ54_10325 [Myxococcaceae bacterium]|nr:hypothetical protein [Myxococcaceae bacterium]